MLKELSYQSFPNSFSALGSHPNHLWLEAHSAIFPHIHLSSQTSYSKGIKSCQNDINSPKNTSLSATISSIAQPKNH
ncbi:hypothetical protein [Mangrovimonas sp. YM274]|uniref:hypothetical protein n=1 Tax=Mangrovimonas sp. YM274 TaxID=3070660 RepID=UPI0027DDA6E4|nr:hypothetical protein [Mangrovimonas sp. YM274]WMI68332.1 hypothetical protein RBH95_14425 [Mangrovimonas sp. YM274]